MKRAPRLTVARFIEALCAAHLSSYVGGYAEDRGGIMVVGPPNSLKSTMVGVLDKFYHDAVVLSDVNMQMLAQLRDTISQGAIRSLVFPELAKLYERHPQTAQNVEGALRAFASEGFRSASFEDSRINRRDARCFVIGALTPALQTRFFNHWEETGFNRRFLWPLITFEAKKLEDAVMHWELLDLRMSFPLTPPDGEIPAVNTRKMAKIARELVSFQPGKGQRALQMAVLTRMYSVLYWHYRKYRRTKSPLGTILAFARALGSKGAELS